MSGIHKNFKGKPGTVALYGDNITYVYHFWTPINDAVVNCKDIDTKIWHSLVRAWRFTIE